MDKKKTAMMASLIILLSGINDVKATSSFELNNDYVYESNEEFGTYNDKKVYIGNEGIVYDMASETNNICIIDDRYGDNPNMQVYNSYTINDLKDLKIILKMLKEYEKQYPTKWKRNELSMIVEWIAHNVCYKLGIAVESTKSVDLDNGAETFGEIQKGLKKIIK